LEAHPAAGAVDADEGAGEPDAHEAGEHMPVERESVERGGLAEVVDDHSSRRRFLRSLGATGGVSALATLAAACGRQKPIGSSQLKPGEVGAFGPGDGGIVNYALFLEYIEGDFYDRVVAGDEISDRRQRDVFKQVRENEAEHRNALDRIADQVGRPIEKPKSNFRAIFARGPRRIVAFAGELENLGAAAYLGQANRLLDTEILASLVSIHTVEARQAAAFNELAGRGFQAGSALRGSIPDGAFARPMTMLQVTRRIRPYFVGAIPTLRPPAD
jgi:rubrerythrin